MEYNKLVNGKIEPFSLDEIEQRKKEEALYEQEKNKPIPTPENIIKEFNALFASKPIEYQLGIASTAAVVVVAIQTGSYELAKSLITIAEIPAEFNGLKAELLAILDKYGV